MDERPIKKHDLKRYNLGPITPPRCPLCYNQMVKKWDSARELFIFTCDTPISCRIAVRVDDPFVNRWEEALDVSTGGESIPCPNPRCPGAPDAPMRYFATMVGFMKAYCPRCDAVISNKEPDRKEVSPDKYYAPDAPGSVQ